MQGPRRPERSGRNDRPQTQMATSSVPATCTLAGATWQSRPPGHVPHPASPPRSIQHASNPDARNALKTKHISRDTDTCPKHAHTTSSTVPTALPGTAPLHTANYTRACLHVLSPLGLPYAFHLRHKENFRVFDARPRGVGAFLR